MSQIESSSRLVVFLVALGAAALAHAADPCVFTPEELKAATGRSFDAGTATQDVSGTPMCAYPETANAKRKLLVGVATEKAAARFDAQQRLLTRDKPIALEGAGEQAYSTNVAAGVLQDGRFIFLSNLRRGSDPKIPAEKVIELLKQAVRRTER